MRKCAARSQLRLNLWTMVAIEQASIQKKCNIQFQKPAPPPQVAAAAPTEGYGDESPRN
jgi:hypothetical protein